MLGWWCGIIIKLLSNTKDEIWVVCFPESYTLKAYTWSHLCPSQEWFRGRWILAPQVLLLIPFILGVIIHRRFGNIMLILKTIWIIIYTWHPYVKQVNNDCNYLSSKWEYCSCFWKWNQRLFSNKDNFAFI